MRIGEIIKDNGLLFEYRRKLVADRTRYGVAVADEWFATALEGLCLEEIQRIKRGAEAHRADERREKAAILRPKIFNL